MTTTRHIDERDEADKRRRQRDVILEFFRHRVEATPGAVHAALRDRLNGAEITSVRRAITNLTDEGFLVRTELVKRSSRGGSEHVWRLRDPDESQRGLFE